MKVSQRLRGQPLKLLRKGITLELRRRICPRMFVNENSSGTVVEKKVAAFARLLLVTIDHSGVCTLRKQVRAERDYPLIVVEIPAASKRPFIKILPSDGPLKNDAHAPAWQTEIGRV